MDYKRIIIVLGLLIITCFGFISNCLYAQSSKSFWFVAPDLSSVHEQSPILLRFINGNSVAATVTISEPANATNFTTITLTVPANSLISYDLSSSIAQIENQPANNTNNYGIFISSDQYISAYYEENGTLNPNIYSLKGDNALGTNFVIPGQNYLDNYPGYNAYSTFHIVATQDNTTVTITPKQDIIGHSAGISFTITLNKGQTYAAVAPTQAAAYHLGGSSVISDKPVAVTVCDDTMRGVPFGGCGNQGGDQIVPIWLLGKTYIAVRGFLNNPGDQIFITATQPNTKVYVNGNTFASATIANVGDIYRYSMGIIDGACSIRTDKDVCVMQMTGSGCEVGLPLLPQLKCTGSRSVTVARTTTDNFYFTVLVEAGGEGHFTITSSSGSGATLLASDFSVVPGTGGTFMYARKQFATAQIAATAVVTVSNSTNKFHLGIIQTTYGGCKVGYFSDFSSSEAKFAQRVLNVCPNESVTLQPTLYVSHSVDPASILYSWNVPDGLGGRHEITASSTTTSYHIDNATLANSGDYIVHVDADGCEASDTITLAVVNSPSKGQVMAAACATELPYIWHGKPFISGGVFTDTVKNAIGCDSIVTLTLKIKQPTSSTLNASICQGSSYTFNGTTYTTAGTYSAILKNSVGCDSTVNLTLALKPKTYSSLYKTACDKIDVNGQTYTSSGDYQQTLTNAQGCDSIITLHLTVLKTTTNDITHRSCNTYSLNGHTYTSSGTYQQKLTNSQGCDSILTLHLIIDLPTGSNTKASICQGDSYLFNGNTYTIGGIYQAKLIGQYGCDSIATLTLDIKQPTSSTLNASMCQGTSYTFNGISYTTAGSYSVVLKNSVGCDSIVNLILAVKPKTYSTLYKTACDKIDINGYTYTSSGDYQQTLTNVQGCDSIITLHITVLKTTTNDITRRSCNTYSLNGHTYTSSGTYQQKLTNSQACDSILTLHLIIDLPTGSETKTSICRGDSYEFNGNTYTTADTYQVKLTSQYGCDSIATLILNELPTYSKEQTISIFSGESYSINGHLYDKGGDYLDMLKTQNGCDSAVITHIILTLVTNTISPNDDGINDIFMKGYHVKIYTRNGLLIFEGKDGWDGKYSGKPVTQDTYFYVLYSNNATEQKIKEGYITVANK